MQFNLFPLLTVLGVLSKITNTIATTTTSASTTIVLLLVLVLVLLLVLVLALALRLMDESCTTLLESRVESERRVGWEQNAREMRAR
jgi:uncharacterized membrane protein